jgi:hypothetical protein
MNTEAAKTLERLVVEHRRRVAEIRADSSLSWEKQVCQIRELGLKFDKDRKEIERSAA